jgi:CTP synthase (UTP-ammonia lyase)
LARGDEVLYPESRPFAPHPLFASFIEAALKHAGKAEKAA